MTVKQMTADVTDARQPRLYECVYTWCRWCGQIIYGKRDIVGTAINTYWEDHICRQSSR